MIVKIDYNKFNNKLLISLINKYNLQHQVFNI